ncbi:3'-5' exoribonuclease YhaM [archaeon BMS3Bbin15]|nr:3'-5' exoribonuclease YhaM [archaeon BMS3Bbin15]
MEKQKLIKNFKDREPIEGFFVVEYKHEIKEYKNGYRFMFGISDKSGEVMVNYWGGPDRKQVEEVFNGFSKGDIVYIKAVSVLYNEKIQVNINPPENTARKALDDEYDLSIFISSSNQDIGEMEEKLFSLVESVKDEKIRFLLESIFKDPVIWSKFKKIPAAKRYHHACIGGLLEHTLGVALFARTACRLHSSLDRDIVIAGALLHDIGKIEEIKITNTIEYTERGMLVGHVALSYEIVKDHLAEADIPETTSMKLLHIILSHHGEKINGSPMEPMFPEAAAVYLADVYDSMITQFIREKKDIDTDDFKIYSNILARRIFVK